MGRWRMFRGSHVVCLRIIVYLCIGIIFEQTKNMEATVLNPVQQHLLKFFAFDGSEEKLLEVKAVLTKYFSQKLDERLDELWDSGVLNQEKLDELRTMHVRTDLKDE